MPTPDLAWYQINFYGSNIDPGCGADSLTTKSLVLACCSDLVCATWYFKGARPYSTQEGNAYQAVGDYNVDAYLQRRGYEMEGQPFEMPTNLTDYDNLMSIFRMINKWIEAPITGLDAKAMPLPGADHVSTTNFIKKVSIADYATDTEDGAAKFKLTIHAQNVKLT